LVLLNANGFQSISSRFTTSSPRWSLDEWLIEPSYGDESGICIVSRYPEFARSDHTVGSSIADSQGDTRMC
jgi:hypothetical protein